MSVSADRDRPHVSQLWLSLRIALRELRSGLQGFYIFLSCLTLGVAAIAAVGSFSKSIELGLDQQGRAILGGDVEMRLVHRKATPDRIEWLERRGKLIEVATLRGMISSPENETRTLTELKAPVANYPLFGELVLTDGSDYRQAIAKRDGRWGVIADPALADRLNVDVGDTLRLGRLQLELRGLIRKEPDRVSGGFFFGPRAMVTTEALRESGLVQPGSLIYWHYKLKLGENASQARVEAFKRELGQAFPDEGWRIRGRDNAAPGTKRFIDRLVLFLSLVGLTTLIVGGLGIGNAVRNFLEARRRNIAMLKCLGAPASSVFQIYFLQVLLLASIGIGTGLVLGTALPWLLGRALEDVLPLTLVGGVHPVPLLTALALGYLTTIAFALWPLGIARELPATALFRSDIQPAGLSIRPRYLLALVVAMTAVAVLALFSFPDRLITLYYFGGVVMSFAVLLGMANLLMWVVRRFPRSGYTPWRLAVANLYRPGTPTVSVMLSLGIGLTLFVTLSQLDANLSRELRQNLPEQAPAFFFMDIQPDGLEAFKETASAIEGVGKIETVPMLRGRIVSINDVPAGKIRPTPDSAWALRGDRGLTYSEDLPRGSKLVAGKWWERDYDGIPLVSFTKDIADGFGVTVGDRVTVNVLGREITATISSLREVDWESLGINFVMVFSPNALRAAPHTHLATVTMDESAESGFLRAVTGQFPTVTAVRVRDALDAISDLLGKLLLAVRGSNVITLLVGILVLAGAMATGLKKRIYDAVILKTLGATRRQLLTAHALEYALLGGLTSVFAVIAGAVAAWAIIRFVMNFEWSFEPATALPTVAFAASVTVIAGFAVTWRALTAKVAPILRVD